MRSTIVVQKGRAACGARVCRAACLLACLPLCCAVLPQIATNLDPGARYLWCCLLRAIDLRPLKEVISRKLFELRHHIQTLRNRNGSYGLYSSLSYTLSKSANSQQWSLRAQSREESQTTSHSSSTGSNGCGHGGQELRSELQRGHAVGRLSGLELNESITLEPIPFAGGQLSTSTSTSHGGGC